MVYSNYFKSNKFVSLILNINIMKQKLYLFYLLLFVLLGSITSKAQSFTENFNTTSGQFVNSFTKTLSGVPFTFTANNGTTYWTNAGGALNSQCVQLYQDFDPSSIDTFVIKRQDGNDFVFTSLFLKTYSASITVVGGYNNNVLVGSVQTLGANASATLNFGGIVVDEVRISSTDLNVDIDDFSGIVVSSATHLNFDGANDNVTIPSAVSGAIAQGSEITIEYWFKGTNLQSAVRIQNGSNYIVAGWGSSNPQFIVSTDGETNGVLNGTESVIEDNTWHHIACVWKKNEIFATYLDGVLQNSRVAANVNLPNLAGTEGKLGSLNGGSEFMTGNLDDVRIWNVARTASQISANRNCELQGNESGLVAYYKFNQGLDAADNTAITTLTDATAAANNGTLVNFTKTGSTSNFLAGSPVTTGITVPTAPTVSAQTFCGVTTANSLVPAISATIKWYASATALVTTDNLTNGTYHVVAVNANGCESERTAVSVVILENPDPETTQSFCNSATVNDLQPAPSATVTWFADANATAALLVTTALVDGTTYYVQATGGSCPPSPIVASTVAITSATAPTNIGGEVTDNANKNLNVVITGACGYYSGLYVPDGTLNGKNKYLGGNNTRIGYDAGNSRWVLYSSNNIAFDAFVLSTTSTDVFPPATGWIATDCSSAVPSTMTTATINYNQIVCVNNNATNLIPPPSETIKWFGSATGTFSLDSNYTLSDVVYYVAGVNENGCESPRTAVTVSFLPQPAAPIVAGTPTSTSGIAVSVTGGCSNFNGNYYYRFTDNNGKNIYDNETNNTSISYDNVSQQWVLGTYVNNGVYSTDFIYPTTSTSAFPPTAGWAVANTNTVCTGVILSIGFTQIEQNYCQGATAANIAGTDPSLKIYNSNGQNIALTDVLTSGIYAVVSVGANGCESDGTMIQINIETVAPPVPAGSSISFASSQIDMTNTCPGSVALFNGTFNYNGQDANGRNKYVFADDAEVELKYLGFPYNWVISKQTNVLFKSDDISTANVPPTSGWTSTCGNVAVTVTVNDFAQSFCGNAQVNDLVATGTGTIKWYNVDTAGTALNSNDAIATGDYYVSQTNNNGCESARTTVNVTVTTLSNATTQNANVVTATENASDVTYQWYQCGTPNVLLTGETNQSYTSTANGDYYVQITKGTCVVSSVCETVLGNSNFEINSGLSIYPNPSKGIFTILSEEDSAIDLYDIIGKKVYSNKVSVGSSTIDLSNYTNGIYLLTVTNQKGNLNTFKLIKQ